jgi:CDP-paratose 2-epimerase
MSEKSMSGKAIIGLLEWFRPGEHDHVEEVLADMRRLGVAHLRTGFSWADFLTPGGEAWYEWLMPRLSREIEVLPCFVYTPPSLGIVPKTSSPPRDPKAFADFLDVMITRFGRHFEWVELWNEPNNLREWDWTLDKDWLIFSGMIGAAAYWCKQRGKKTLLGGPGPSDPNWLRMMCERGVVKHCDAVGVHGFPHTFEFTWEGWPATLAKLRAVLDRHGEESALWITETGYSTALFDERKQILHLQGARLSGAERVYWYAARDLDPALPTIDGFHSDEREYHFGLRYADGAPKLIHRLWSEGGLDAVADAAWMNEPAAPFPKGQGHILVTGGAGYLGTALVDRLAEGGAQVRVFDNLSRPESERNLRWLKDRHPDNVRFDVADIRNPHALREALRGADRVFHLAAREAAPGEAPNPALDFEVNLQGTLNLLEALRRGPGIPLIMVSSHSVYGDLEALPLREEELRYHPQDPHLTVHGVGEDVPLGSSPGDCSRAAAEQYALTYGRDFSLPVSVLRLGHVYGPCPATGAGQGWLEDFLRAWAAEKEISGDGKKVRDFLHIGDMAEALALAGERARELAGKVYNVGGGPAGAMSALEIAEWARMRAGLGAASIKNHGTTLRPDRKHATALHPEGPLFYVSDNRRFTGVTGWVPTFTAMAGLEGLVHLLPGRIPAAVN